MIELADYKILKKIGSGGMGDVYLAVHKVLETTVAIKSLHSNLVKDETFRKRFKTEAKIHAKLNHLNVVKLIDFQQTKDGLFIIMEYVEGQQLDDYIKNESGPIPEKELISLFLQIVNAISHAHSKGLVHRDIKPANVIISKGKIKVLDFGIAKELSSESGLTKTGVQVGTPMYMSPEQVNADDLDNLTDIYSLGVTLFYMAVGNVPYENSNAMKMGIQIVTKPFPKAQDFYPAVSNKIEQIIKKATQKNKGDRYQSCKEFIEALKSDDVSTFREINKNKEINKSQNKVKNKVKNKKSAFKKWSNFFIFFYIFSYFILIWYRDSAKPFVNEELPYITIKPVSDSILLKTEDIAKLNLKKSEEEFKLKREEAIKIKEAIKREEAACCCGDASCDGSCHGDAEAIKREEAIKRYEENKKLEDNVLNDGVIDYSVEVSSTKVKEKIIKKTVEISENNKNFRTPHISAIEYYNRGNLLRDKGTLRKAIKNYSNAININSNYTEAYFQRGKIYVELKEFQKALDDFTYNINLNSNNKDAYRDRAVCKRILYISDFCSDYKQACKLGDERSCSDYKKCK